MNKFINICLIISLVFFVSCYVFRNIDYSIVENPKLMSYIPSIHTHGNIFHGKSNIYISYKLDSYDSIQMRNMIPILNKIDTMKLVENSYRSINQSYMYIYSFGNSEALIKSNGFELIIDVMLFKGGIAERYTDTIYVKEHKRHYRNWGDDIFPKIGH